MPSTYSSSLRLELIGDGEQSGTWGQTTNRNLGTLVDTAVAGVASVSMTDANYTLTSLNGAADEARNAILVISGTLTAPRNVVAPSVEKAYVIKNSTGQVLTIKTSGGTGVVIPAGATMAVYCDGTNFHESLSYVTALTAGALTLTSGTTGTGDFVRATSPTIATPTISSPALTGVPTAPTATPGTNTTQVASTAFVTAAISTGGYGTVTSVDASGGSTGMSFSGGPVTSSGTLTLGGTLSAANGGTGRTSLTTNAVILGNGTGQVQQIVGGASGQVLTWNGTTWVATTASSGVSSFNTRTGAVTLTSSDVTTALGFTPPATNGTGATGTWGINISGSAATATSATTASTVTNGVYTTGAYANPAWITSLATSKLSGTVAMANGGTGTTAPRVVLVRKESAQSFDANLWTVIGFDNEASPGLDPQGVFDTGTYRCTPGVAGYYLVSVKATLVLSVAGVSMAVGMRVNGSTRVSSTFAFGGSGQYCAAESTAVVYLGVSDYVEGVLFQTNGTFTAQPLASGGGFSEYNTFSVAYLRPAS